MASKDRTFRVVVLCRPLNALEVEANYQSFIDIEDRCVVKVKGEGNKPEDVLTFEYDGAYLGAPSELVYEEQVQDLVKSALNGVGAVILAYGQTGSGKTFVSCGASGEGQRTAGVIALAVQDLMQSIAQENDPLSTKIYYSMYEVYMEGVNDLVSKKEGLHLFDTADGLVIQGMTEKRLCNIEQDMRIIQRACKERVTASTRLNSNSSRSHLGIQFKIYQKTTKGQRTTQLDIVDLAGAENVFLNDSSKTRKEGIKINQSLTVLRQILEEFAKDKTKTPTIPSFRTSALTRLLRPSLGERKSACVLLSCISPSHRAESLSTLKFSRVAKTIELHPEEVAFCKQGGAKQKLQDLAAAKEEIKELRRQLNVLQNENATVRAVTPEPKLNGTIEVSSDEEEDVKPDLRILPSTSCLQQPLPSTSGQERPLRRSPCNQTSPPRQATEVNFHTKLVEGKQLTLTVTEVRSTRVCSHPSPSEYCCNDFSDEEIANFRKVSRKIESKDELMKKAVDKKWIKKGKYNNQYYLPHREGDVLRVCATLWMLCNNIQEKQMYKALKNIHF